MAGKKIAVLIGINNYENCGLLNYAVQDVEAFRDILIDPQRGGYQAEYIKLLTDNQGPRPHRANILQTVGNITQGTDTEDRILVYFAGHGLTHENEAYLVPIEGYPDNADQTCISIKLLQEQLERSKAGTRLLILDACHSGLELGRPTSGLMTARFEAALHNIHESSGMAVLSSCKASQASLEDSKLSHGVFSYYLTEGLKGPADSDKDYDISILEAYEYVTSNVSAWAMRNNKSQTPTLFAKMAGELPLVTVPKPVSQEANPSAVVISRILFEKTGHSYAYDENDRESYTKAKDSAYGACESLLGEIGVVFAELYGPENISGVDNMNYSYPRGTFGATVSSEDEKFTSELYIKASSDALDDQPLLDAILTRLGFSNLEFQLMSPVNLVNFFKLAPKSDLKVTSFNPPLQLEAKTSKSPHFSLLIQNTTSSASVYVSIISPLSFGKVLSVIRETGPRPSDR